MQLLWVLRRQAYDRVLRSVLYIYGVGEQLLKGIQAFYIEANAYVRVRREFSEFAVEEGVRQGCVMSSWLISLWMGA